MGQNHRAYGPRITRRRALAITGVTTLALAGCTTTAPEATVAPAATVARTASPAAGAPAPAATAAPPTPVAKYGGMLSMIGVAVPHFDMQQVSTTGLLGQPPGFCYSRLLRYKVGADVQQPSFTVIGDLAESWTQPDEQTFLFKLRPNAKWHNKPPANGRAVTAEDVVFSFTRQRDLKVNAGAIDAIDTFSAVDPTTVKVTLKRVDPDFLVDLAYIGNKIVNRETVDARGDLKSGDIVGTGPWMTKEPLDPQKIGSVYRNPDYFEKGLPYLDGLTMNVLTDPATRNAALRSKQMDMDVVMGDPVTVQTTRKAVPDLYLASIRAASPAEFGVQAGDGPTKDVRVRQAIAKAIDRKAIIETSGGVNFLPQTFPLPDPSWGLSDSELQTLYKPDLDAARRLLREGAQENGFSLKTVVTNAVGGFYGTVAEQLNAQLRPLKIELVLEVTDNSTYTDRLNRGAFEAWCGSATSLNASTANTTLLTRYLTGGTRNVQKLSDPKLDDMIRRQSTQSRDVEARKKALQDLQRYLANDQPSVYAIVGTTQDWLAWPYVKNLYPAAYGQTAHWITILWMDK
jgi:peptide/nickel transport system substrate-binding protein